MNTDTSLCEFKCSKAASNRFKNDSVTTDRELKSAARVLTLVAEAFTDEFTEMNQQTLTHSCLMSD